MDSLDTLTSPATKSSLWKVWFWQEKGGDSLAAHLETTIGKMPAQMVTRGTAMKKGVAIAPTMYDHTPLQYIMRWKKVRRLWKKGQWSLLSTIWK